MKEVFPHKENTFIGFGKKYSFKAKKRFGNQKTGTNLVLQNHFETLDVKSNFTVYELPNRRENLNISIPSNNANSSSNNNFSNKLNSTKQRPQVVINQNPENDNDYQKSKFVPGDNLYSEAGQHYSSTSNSNNIVVFGGSIPNFSRKCKYDFNKNANSLVRNQRISYVTPMRRYKMQRTMPLSSTWIQSHDQTTQLMCTLRKISAKCKPYGIKHVFVSSLLYT